MSTTIPRYQHKRPRGGERERERELVLEGTFDGTARLSSVNDSFFQGVVNPHR